MPIGWESQDLTRLFSLIDRCRHRPNSQLPGSKLHEGRRLSGVEHDLELGSGSGVRMATPRAAPARWPAHCPHSESALRIALSRMAMNCQRLLILGGLRPASGIENGVDDIFRQWLVLEFADGPLGSNGCRYVHTSFSLGGRVGRSPYTCTDRRCGVETTSLNLILTFFVA